MFLNLDEMAAVIFDMFKEQFRKLNEILTIECEIPFQMLGLFDTINYICTDSDQPFDHTITITF